MTPRMMTQADIPAVTDLYWTMVQEEKKHHKNPYPRVTPSVRKDIAQLLSSSIIVPQWHGEVLEKNDEIIGFATGSLIHRPYCQPGSAFRLDIIYISPEHRGGRNAIRLINAMWKWGFHALADFIPDEKERTIEGAWTPGSLAEKLWTSAGCAPYMVLCSWTGPDGFPHPNVERLTKPKE